MLSRINEIAEYLRGRPFLLSLHAGRSTILVVEDKSDHAPSSHSKATQESTGLRPASSESGPMGLRAFIIILPSAERLGGESRVLQAGEIVVVHGSGPRERHLTVTAAPTATTRTAPTAIPAMAPSGRLAADVGRGEAGGLGGEGGSKGDGAIGGGTEGAWGEEWGIGGVGGGGGEEGGTGGDG